jgi:2'-5' RNA ligase
LTEYDWGSPGATGIVVPFLEAEPAIGSYRRAHSPSGEEGMYAHVTLLAPFLHASQLSREDSVVIRDALGPFDPFAVTLSSFGCFEQIGCLYLEPDPAEPFVAMSEALLVVYPEIDYPGAGLEIVPHVTIGGGLTVEPREQIKRELAPHLPIQARADSVVLVERGEDGRWFDREAFPL